MSTKTLGVVGRGSGRQNSIPTIPTIPTVSTVPTIPTPWGCSKLSIYQCTYVHLFLWIKFHSVFSRYGFLNENFQQSLQGMVRRCPFVHTATTPKKEVRDNINAKLNLYQSYLHQSSLYQSSLGPSQNPILDSRISVLRSSFVCHAQGRGGTIPNFHGTGRLLMQLDINKRNLKYF